MCGNKCTHCRESVSIRDTQLPTSGQDGPGQYDLVQSQNLSRVTKASSWLEDDQRIPESL